MVGKLKRADHGRLKVAVVVITVLLTALMLLVAGGVYWAVRLPSIQQAREAQRRQQTSENLKRIGEALHAYHQEAEALPTKEREIVVPTEEVSSQNPGDDLD